jgi:hypothetical protein
VLPSHTVVALSDPVLHLAALDAIVDIGPVVDVGRIIRQGLRRNSLWEGVQTKHGVLDGSPVDRVGESIGWVSSF